MLSLPIYLDNNATTRTDPRVVESMLPYFTEIYGNAASRHHSFGWQADRAVETAREQVASLIGAAAREIVFTSGATESDNLALKGVMAAAPKGHNHLVTVATEHRAVLDSARRLQSDGVCVTILPVDRKGRVTLQQVADALTQKTALVSVMTANNEIGTIQPIQEIGKICHERGVLLHTDAVQAASTLPLNVSELGVDLLSLSGHKMYGPKGVGALFVRRGGRHVALEPIIDGGGHERGLRSGTLPVPLIVGFGAACELCQAERTTEADRLTQLRERLRSGIMDQLDAVTLNGTQTQRLPGNLNLSFAYIHGDALLIALQDIAVSTGSACTSAEPEPSYVLRAIGVDDELAQASLRFGLGRFTTAEEIDYAIEAVVRAVSRLRAMCPDYEMYLDRQNKFKV